LRLWILDLDGVVYRGDKLIEGAKEFVEEVRDRGEEVVFLTNNSLFTPQFYSEKLTRLGIPVEARHIYTSAELTGAYLQESGIKKVFAIGEEGLKKALLQRGIRLLETPDVEAVVVGLDRNFHYRKLVIAYKAIEKGAHFLATNTDPTLPCEDGLLPGSGSIVASVEKATGKRPVVIGKPEPVGIQLILKERGEGKEAFIVGDRIDTDVLAGKRAGIKTVLVLTGVTTRAEIDKIPPSHRPDVIVDTLEELLK